MAAMSPSASSPAIALVGLVATAVVSAVSSAESHATPTQALSESLVVVRVPHDLPDTWHLPVDVGGAPHTLELWSHDVLAPGFRVLVSEGTGAREVELPDIKTYRGRVLEIPGSLVTASVVRGALRARAVMPDGQALFSIEPLLGGSPSTYSVFGTPSRQVELYQAPVGGDQGRIASSISKEHPFLQLIPYRIAYDVV